MKLQVIGFEGSRDQDSPVSWGVAAIAFDEVIINAETRHQTPLEDLDDLVAEGHLTRFNSAIQIDERASELPLVVVELARVDPVFPFLVADTGRLGGLVAHRHGRDFVVYIFENQDSLDLYARDAATKIAHALLYDSWQEDEAPARLLRAGLILAANHPALNALHVARVKESRRSLAREIAIAAIAGVHEADAFGELLDALIASEDEDYVIKYEDGIAEGGGLDVDQGVRILGGAKDAHTPFVKDLVRRYPYLDEPPHLRLSYMVAASASLHFTANIKGRPIGERVARRLELRMLERTLRGEVVPGLPEPQRVKVARAVEKLLADDNTTVSQKPIGRELEERLTAEAEKPRGRAQRSEPLTVLGYQSGLIDLASQVEVVVFPPIGSHHRSRLRLSTRDDGDGNEPLGVHPFQEGDRDLLYQPMLFTVMKIIHPGGQEKTHLRKVRALAADSPGVVTAIPSSVVDGAVIYGVELRLRRPSPDRLVCDLGPVKGLSHATLRGAREWMEQWALVCRTFEVQPKPGATLRYWRPSRPPPPSALQRLLIVLKDEKGCTHQSHLVSLVNERFGGAIRTNNTRREVLRNPTLLAFDDDDPQTIRATLAGLQLAAAFERAGGKTAKAKKR
jgi:hypothetical protein